MQPGRPHPNYIKVSRKRGYRVVDNGSGLKNLVFVFCLTEEWI